MKGRGSKRKDAENEASFSIFAKFVSSFDIAALRVTLHPHSCTDLQVRLMETDQTLGHAVKRGALKECGIPEESVFMSIPDGAVIETSRLVDTLVGIKAIAASSEKDASDCLCWMSSMVGVIQIGGLAVRAGRASASRLVPCYFVAC